MTAREWLSENLDKVLLADGFDEALIGYAYSPGRGHIAIYDAGLCVQALTQRGMSELEAIEFFEFNVEGSWIGRGTPVFLYRIPLDEEAE